MFIVSLHPGYYELDGGQHRIIGLHIPPTVPTLEEAKALVREKFPRAVFASRWIALYTRPDRGADPATWITPAVQLPDGYCYWWHSSIQVFPNSTAMELDRCRDRECGLIVNDNNEPPEPGARLFYGSRQLLDV